MRAAADLLFFARCRKGSEHGKKRTLQRTATPVDGPLESFNCPVEFVALCDEKRDDVVSRHIGIRGGGSTRWTNYPGRKFAFVHVAGVTCEGKLTRPSYFSDRKRYIQGRANCLPSSET